MKVDKIWFPKNRLIPQLQPNISDDDKKKLRDLRQDILGLLLKQRFISFIKLPRVYFDNQLNCLWLLHGFQAQSEDMFKYVSKLQIHHFRHWSIPTASQVRSIIQEPLFTEHPTFQEATLLTSTSLKGDKGYLTIGIGQGEEVAADDIHYLIPTHQVSQRDILSFIVANTLVPKDVEGVPEKLKELYNLTMALSQGSKSSPTPSLRAVKQYFLEGDFNRARLPVLESDFLYDINKGLWELHQLKPPKTKGWVEVRLPESWEARNPELDIREGMVTIDFGTSSTVVACREHGQTVLLRVGLGDLFRKPKPEDYQNPTILAFIHLPNLLAAWNSESYRPQTRWEDFHFSHEALSLFRENEANQRIVGSILTNIKQWPLSAITDSHPLRILDQDTGTDLEIRPTSNAMPVPGQPVTVSPDDPLDPIELYAYYLGLFINHRVNGLFLEYYMTFPVTYPKEVKESILASFGRGLQRSMPASLMNSDRMARFSVREEGSEPAAYAACALEELKIEATREGTAFAVFDFGGGSSDFDFGIYRLPYGEEEAGYETVLRHFGASGDMFLGGENLVAHLAYLTFQHNIEICRKHKIPFACPPEGRLFPGSELFVDYSHIAQTNSTMLMAKVRPIWENFDWAVEEGVATTPSGGKAAPPPSRRRSDRIGDALA
ncbi:MAG: hypothetical protein HQL52_18820, partial [Magnetococcales bacterium]|nr:hypothetical protein [Magnetococcales bacterium]